MSETNEPWWKQPHDPNCPGCRPVMVDPETGKCLPQDDPVMVAVNKVYDDTTDEERRAWHAFTCQNSRDTKVMELVGNMQFRFQQAIKALEEGVDA